MQLTLSFENARDIDKGTLMKACEIKGITNDAIVHIPSDVSLERIPRALLGVEARPVTVKRTAALLRGYLNADCIAIYQSCLS